MILEKLGDVEHTFGPLVGTHSDTDRDTLVTQSSLFVMLRVLRHAAT